ncbi:MULTISPECIES: dihydroxyacetone kinase subunit DhaL [unclassified Streptomyces]|uniref:dihydroxyacetone kinase subunit DhaL n=1 Tax=unclassified Streptomyces TaxID=2593676 RepID=UPI000823D092|nr:MULTISPECIES: dihydroxyacetone kinase subunit DhaL [unclassified Streptomyces]MYU01577.1 dihydroxyacetone kinase subunit L [Streptomyces sp. SID8350]SCK26350.1 dihydroxyacetone kinase, C-terminal domain [Streptomyces sp. AmelKG-D3]
MNAGAGSADFTSGWMRRFAEAAHDGQPLLTALDQQVGDGDFGVNLTAGVDAARPRLDRLPDRGADPSAPLLATAEAFLDEVGGTSGPLFGLLLHSLAAAIAADGLTTAALADGFASGLAAIQRVGGAGPGDKTLVDALAPATDVLRSTDPSAPAADALAAAAASAWDGVAATARLRARMGRSSYLGERTEGIPDPGAVGVALLLSCAQAGRPDLGAHLDAVRAAG